MRDFDVHGTNRKMELFLRKIEDSQISNQNKQIILKFYEYISTIGLGKKRILKYLYSLHNIAHLMEVPLEDATTEDIMKLVRKIEQGDYSEWTKHDYKVVIKRFYKWINGTRYYPEKVEWIKTTFRKNKVKLPRNLITQQDVEAMIRVAEHVRDKALIAFCYESGFRIEEVLTLRIENIVINDNCAKIVGDGKTGSRGIILISSVPYLAAWIENHPFRNVPDAPLWVKIGTEDKDEIMRYDNARRIIKTLAKKAHINKRIYPHLFRHSRATYLANKFTESQLNHYFGWAQGSPMPSTYVHLSGRDLEDKIFEINGLKDKKKEEKEEPTVKKCPRCSELNQSIVKFCRRCGSPFEQNTVMEIEEKWKKLNSVIGVMFDDPEVFNLLTNKLKQMNIKLDAQPSVK